MKKLSFAALVAAGGLLIVVSFGIGYVTRVLTAPAPASEPADASASTQQEPEQKKVRWTCSMHPQIIQPEPGLCPICGMKLIPLEEGGQDEGPRTLVVSETAKMLMDIQTSLVERRYVEAEVRMVGKVDYDEKKLGHITAWVGGRIDRLFVDYTGITVNKGDHMVTLYSPDLVTTQDDLLQAIRSAKVLGESASRTVDAVRERLRLWGLSPEQIADIEKRGRATDHITIYAPMGGIVIDKHAQQGMYVRTGMRIYTIADLSELWVKLEAYESDLEWVRYGQKVSVTTEAYPGEVFEGKIAFIDPVLNEKTRTVRVRVNVPNPDFKLKPNMFVHAVVRSKVATGGRVMVPDLAGKWISPMHPEIIKDAPGMCDVCGMPLKKAEALGYVSVPEDEASKPLVIPVSAALFTGKRAVVYVAVPDTEKPTFEGREVVLGARAGDFYLVEKGLAEGERVVTNGNFKIDSALQILAKPSMMSPEGGGAPAGHQHGGAPGSPARAKTPRLSVPDAFHEQLESLWKAYQDEHAALAGDDLDGARAAHRGLTEALGGIDMSLLDQPAHMAWMKYSANLEKAAAEADGVDDIEALRKSFALLSEEMRSTLATFGVSPVVILHCPMAFNSRGASWLQADEAVRNPYFGAAMLKCGDVTGTLPGTHTE